MDMKGVEKVKKGLTVCSTMKYCDDTDCPYRYDGNCAYALPRDALDAITYLQEMVDDRLGYIATLEAKLRERKGNE